MTSRTTHLQPQRASVRRLVVDALLTTAHNAIKNGAHADDVSAAMLAAAIDFSLHTVTAEQVAVELRHMADEVAELLPTSADKAH